MLHFGQKRAERARERAAFYRDGFVSKGDELGSPSRIPVEAFHKVEVDNEAAAMLIELEKDGKHTEGRVGGHKYGVRPFYGDQDVTGHRESRYGFTANLIAEEPGEDVSGVPFKAIMETYPGNPKDLLSETSSARDLTLQALITVLSPTPDIPAPHPATEAENALVLQILADACVHDSAILCSDDVQNGLEAGVTYDQLDYVQGPAGNELSLEVRTWNQSSSYQTPASPVFEDIWAEKYSLYAQGSDSE